MWTCAVPAQAVHCNAFPKPPPEKPGNTGHQLVPKMQCGPGRQEARQLVPFTVKSETSHGAELLGAMVLHHGRSPSPASMRRDGGAAGTRLLGVPVTPTSRQRRPHVGFLLSLPGMRRGSALQACLDRQRATVEAPGRLLYVVSIKVSLMERDRPGPRQDC